MTSDIPAILATTHPYDALPEAARIALADTVKIHDAHSGDVIYTHGAKQTHLYLIVSGQIEIQDDGGETLSILGPRNSFGERGLLKGGIAAVTATATEDSRLIAFPAATVLNLIEDHPRVRRFFDRTRPAAARRQDITTMALADLMTRDPLTCAPGTTLIEAARKMRDLRVSCIIVLDEGAVAGILTTRDLTNRVLAEGVPYESAVDAVMTTKPVTLPPTALVADVLHTMMERGITHMPVVDAGKLIGILTQTDLIRFQATSSAALIKDIADAKDGETLARIVAKIPELLVQLVAAQNAHHVVTRLITDIGDAATRRLLALAEDKLGAPPVPYLWLACGSQGRQEQTGVSDQDNCMILDNTATAAHDAYFEAMAHFVSDGLDACGYFYCPGDMMATNGKWRQPLRIWEQYFAGWIASPDNEAQMLASVMFDLRPIGGTYSLFEDLQERTLEATASNSIFVAHMVSNSVKHQPPLGLFRGFATVRSSEHKNTIDLKHNGVVPVVDLGRVYALQSRLSEVNTRARLAAAINAGAVSPTGGRDLLDAYDVIAQQRLEHQAAQIRRGEKPDNFMAPSDLSDFERSHLRDAFVVIKTMQNAAGSGRGYLS